MIIETCSAVLDVQDMKLSQVTREFLALVKGIAAIDKDQYPETLGKLFIINVPSVFPLVWRTVQFFLDPATAAKIQIFGAKKDWLPALTDQIGLENMPSTYGGYLPALSSDVHPYATTMTEYEKRKTNKENSGENVVNYGEDESEHIDEIDMYIRRGQIATEQLRLQALYPPTSPSTTPWGKVNPLRKIMGAFSPGKSNPTIGTTTSARQSLSSGVADADSVAADLSPAITPSFPTSLPPSSSIPPSSFSSFPAPFPSFSHSQSSKKDAENTDSTRRKEFIPIPLQGVQKVWNQESKFQAEQSGDIESPSESKRQTNSYINNGRDGMGEREESQKDKDNRTICDKICTLFRCGFMLELPCIRAICKSASCAFDFLTFEHCFKKSALKELKRYLYTAVSLYMIAALTATVVSAYLVSETLWMSSVALYVHLWTGVVVLLVAVVMMAANIAAYLGCYYQNRALLIMYSGLVGSGAFVFSVIAIVSFLYSSYPAVSELSGTLEASLKDRTAGVSNVRLHVCILINLCV